MKILRGLRNSLEFRNVYNYGWRYDSRSMTVFVWPNDLQYHRIGVTASRRISRLAVERNRLKRLLREAFRLSEFALGGTKTHYDWVMNAKRSLLGAKVVRPLNELHSVIAQLSPTESKPQSADNQSES